MDSLGNPYGAHSGHPAAQHDHGATPASDASGAPHSSEHAHTGGDDALDSLDEFLNYERYANEQYAGGAGGAQV